MTNSPFATTRSNAVFIGGLVVALGLVVGLCGILYLREAREIEQTLYDREKLRVERLDHFIRSELRPVANDVRALADGDGLRAFLASGLPGDRDRAVRQAVLISRQQPSYDQIRYLDESGQEIIRVNQGGQVVPAAELKNKSSRPYFQKASSLADGQLFISAFDLNVENGRVEEPYKAMLRFAVPVFDESGRRRGVYIINYLGHDVIDHLEQITAPFAHRLRLLNSEGYWIKAVEPAREWGFSIPERAEHTLARLEPPLWARMSQEPEGQARFAGGLLTWHRTAPREFAGVNVSEAVTEDPFLLIASEVNASEWTALFSGLRTIFFIVTPCLVALVTSSAWFFRSRQRALFALRQSEENLAVTLQSIGDAVLATDTTGKITRMNRMAEELTGWTQAEAEGQPIAEVFRIFHEKTREPAVVPVAEVLATGEARELANSTILVSRDGTERPIADSASPIRDRQGNLLGVVLVFRDVSVEQAHQVKLKAVLDELAREQARLKRIFDLVPIGIAFSITQADGHRTRLINDAHLRICGLTREQAESPTIFTEITHPDDRTLQAKLSRPLETGANDRYSLDKRYIHADGRIVWVLLSFQRQWFEDGSYEDLSFVLDITERKQAEVQLRTANAELEAFSYSVSHDLRAPLRHVHGYVEMLSREAGPQLTDKARRYLKTISDAGREMGELIDNLLAFSRMGRTDMHESLVDLDHLVRQVQRELDAASPGRNISWQIATLPKVKGDPAMVRQVLSNLMGNAVKYTRGRDPAEIEIGSAGEEDARLVFFVRDNGAGFEMKYADKLFGVFQRLHRADDFEGTGIGLATVRRIITRHGGRTWGTGEPNAGATFFFTLKPACAPPVTS